MTEELRLKDARLKDLHRLADACSVAHGEFPCGVLDYSQVEAALIEGGADLRGEGSDPGYVAEEDCRAEERMTGRQRGRGAAAADCSRGAAGDIGAEGLPRAAGCAHRGPPSSPVRVDGADPLVVGGPLCGRAYDEHYRRFTEFAQKHRLPVQTLDALDWALTEFIDELYTEGHQADAGKKTIAAVRYMRPECVQGGRYPLARAGRALKGFLKAEPSLSRSGLSFKSICGFASVMIRNGLVAEASALLLSYGAYLRPGEVVDLLKEDAIAPVEPAVSPPESPAERPQNGLPPMKLRGDDEIEQALAAQLMAEFKTETAALRRSLLAQLEDLEAHGPEDSGAHCAGREGGGPRDPPPEVGGRQGGPSAASGERCRGDASLEGGGSGSTSRHEDGGGGVSAGDGTCC